LNYLLADLAFWFWLEDNRSQRDRVHCAIGKRGTPLARYFVLSRDICCFAGVLVGCNSHAAQ